MSACVWVCECARAWILLAACANNNLKCYLVNYYGIESLIKCDLHGILELSCWSLLAFPISILSTGTRTESEYETTILLASFRMLTTTGTRNVNHYILHTHQVPTEKCNLFLIDWNTYTHRQNTSIKCNCNEVEGKMSRRYRLYMNVRDQFRTKHVTDSKQKIIAIHRNRPTAKGKKDIYGYVRTTDNRIEIDPN